MEPALRHVRTLPLLPERLRQHLHLHARRHRPGPLQGHRPPAQGKVIQEGHKGKVGIPMEAAMQCQLGVAKYRVAQNHGIQVLGVTHTQFHLPFIQFVVIPHG